MTPLISPSRLCPCRIVAAGFQPGIGSFFWALIRLFKWIISNSTGDSPLFFLLSLLLPETMLVNPKFNRPSICHEFTFLLSRKLACFSCTAQRLEIKVERGGGIDELFR